MRTTTQNAVLQALADAGGQPVAWHDLRKAAAGHLPATEATVIDDEDDIWNADTAAGTALRVTRPAEPGDVAWLGNEVRSLQDGGWVIRRHDTRGDGGWNLAWSLDGRSCLAGVPAASRPAELPAEPAQVMRLWLLSGGARGVPRATLDEWLGHAVMDVEFFALAENLRAAGYMLDCTGSGSSFWHRIVATPDIPVLPAPVPGTDVRLVTDPGDPPAPPVGLAEIAERLDVDRATADKWRSRKILPAPAWPVGGRPAWPWPVIEQWARETGRLPRTVVRHA